MHVSSDRCAKFVRSVTVLTRFWIQYLTYSSIVLLVPENVARLRIVTDVSLVAAPVIKMRIYAVAGAAVKYDAQNRLTKDNIGDNHVMVPNPKPGVWTIGVWGQYNVPLVDTFEGELSATMYTSLEDSVIEIQENYYTTRVEGVKIYSPPCQSVSVRVSVRVSPRVSPCQSACQSAFMFFRINDIILLWKLTGEIRQTAVKTFVNHLKWHWKRCTDVEWLSHGMKSAGNIMNGSKAVNCETSNVSDVWQRKMA